MNPLRVIAFTGLLAGICLTAQGQNVSGSSVLQLDASSGILTGTCQTLLDEDSMDYYDPNVRCTLYNGDMTVLTSTVARGFDGDADATATLTYQSSEGNVYILLGQHFAIPILQDKGDTDDPPNPTPPADDMHWVDYFLLRKAESEGALEENYYLYFGTPPSSAPSESKRTPIHIADTDDSVARPATQATLSLNASGTVSSLDPVKDNYSARVGDQNLGLHSGTFPNGDQGCLIGYELAGLLSPPNASDTVTVSVSLRQEVAI